jgi:hypothetical protein
MSEYQANPIYVLGKNNQHVRLPIFDSYRTELNVPNYKQLSDFDYRTVLVSTIGQLSVPKCFFYYYTEFLYSKNKFS